MLKSGITKEEIISWGGLEVFNQALAICNSGTVGNVEYDDDALTISGSIDRGNGWSMPVSLKLEAKGRIVPRCPCYANQKLGQVCPHVAAIAIARMAMEMDDREEEAAPSAGADDCAAAEDGDFIEIPVRPKFYAYVTGSRASVSIALDAWYGEINFPACSVQAPETVRLPDPDDPSVRRVRSLETEREAFAHLESLGFERGYRENDLRLYMSSPQGVLDFLGSGMPELRRRGWKIELAPALEAIVDSMPSVLPVVQLRDAPGGCFDVRYSFEAGGTSIPPAEIQAALNRGDGCILRDGTPVLLDNAAIETMHDVFRDCASTQDGAPPGWFRVRAVHAPYVASALGALGDVIDVDAGAAPEWAKSAAALSGKDNPADAEPRFESVSLGDAGKILRPYQKTGVYWMRHLENRGMNGLLADEMGLGKTLQTLVWLALPHGDGPRRPAIVVAPTSLVRNWEAEAAKFIPSMKTLVISGPDRARDFPKIPSADLVVTSYSLLQRDFEEAYAGVEFSVAVIDEAQHIKNRRTKNALCVKMLDAGGRLALTGTPVENSVADVWSIFDFLMPDYLGDYESFKLRYEDPAAEGGTGAETALERLKRKLEPFIMRRLKKTVAKDLPDKIVKVSLCPLSEESQREYAEALSKTRTMAGETIRAKGFEKSKFELLAMLMKLRQIASRGKYDAFREQLDSAIEAGHRVLVFSQFVKTLKAIAEDLDASGIRYCYLDGSTKDRLGECNRFNKNRSIPVFLISLMAGGTGLNLTGADMVIHYDPWWNPAVEDQATDRAHRIGQTKNVFVVKMIAADTIEEKVLALQRRKQAVIAATVGTTDAAVMDRLTAEDVKELLG